MQEWAGSGAGMEGGAGTVAGTVAGTQAPAAAGRTRQSGGGGECMQWEGHVCMAVYCARVV